MKSSQVYNSHNERVTDKRVKCGHNDVTPNGETYTQSQVDELVAKERERACKIVSSGFPRDVHVYADEVLREIREGDKS